MELILTRTGHLPECTTGVLYLQGELVAHTLEPQWRDLRHEKKVPGRTAIPEGAYRIRLETSPRFKQRMPYLMDVPGFTGILIHAGNGVEDTQGCILVGERAGHSRLKNSRATLVRLLQLMEKAENEGERIYIKMNHEKNEETKNEK